MSKNNRNDDKKSSPPSGPRVFVQQASKHFETITLEEALAQSTGKGLGLLHIPNMTPPGWEEVIGIAASDVQTMNALTELAHRLQHSGEVREKKRRARKKERRQLSASAPVVDHVEVAILRALDKHAPELRNLYDLADDTRVARKTIGLHLTALIEEGLAERPKGKRKGATITPTGKALLLKCSPP